MTKEEFYKNCLTEEGQEKIREEFRNNNSILKGYYKKNIDINNYEQWNEIVYMPKYGNVNEFNDTEYGDILEVNEWEVYTMWDILIWIMENGCKEEDAFNTTREIYSNLKGQEIWEIYFN